MSPLITETVPDVRVLPQEDKTLKRKHEYVFVLPDRVSKEGMQATIAEDGKVRVSVPVRTT